MTRKEKFADRKIRFRHMGYFALIFVFMAFIFVVFMWLSTPVAPVVHHPAPISTAVQDNVTSVSRLVNDTAGSSIFDYYDRIFEVTGNFLLAFVLIGGIIVVFASIASMLRRELS